MTAIKKWTFVKRKMVLEHPRMSLAEDKVKLPNNKEVSYLIELPGRNHSVTVIAINSVGELLLQREYSYPPNEILWQLPGGGMNDGETIETAALRELSEESNLTAQSTKFIGYFYTNNRRSDQKQYVVVCKDLKEEKGKADPEEFIESEWVSIDTLNKLIANGEIYNMNLLAAIQLWSQSKS